MMTTTTHSRDRRFFFEYGTHSAPVFLPLPPGVARRFQCVYTTVSSLTDFIFCHVARPSFAQDQRKDRDSTPSTLRNEIAP